MSHRIRRAILLGSVLCVGACDEATEPDAAAPVNAEASVVVKADAKAAVVGALDLQALLDDIGASEIASAAELEVRLNAKDAPKVDADGDGTTDNLHVVERRTPTSTSFEIRATASDDAETEVEDATLVATIELQPAPDDGVVEVTAAYAPAFAASASIDLEATTVRHRAHGVTVHADGEYDVTAEAGVFVVWAFRPERPMFVASVFIGHEHEHEHGCWPPGHCKHGKWKAHDGLPPGQAKKHGHDDGHDGRGGKGKHKPKHEKPKNGKKHKKHKKH